MVLSQQKGLLQMSGNVIPANRHGPGGHGRFAGMTTKALIQRY
jgi:hypothetical protein